MHPSPYHALLRETLFPSCLFSIMSPPPLSSTALTLGARLYADAYNHARLALNRSASGASSGYEWSRAHPPADALAQIPSPPPAAPIVPGPGLGSETGRGDDKQTLARVEEAVKHLSKSVQAIDQAMTTVLAKLFDVVETKALVEALQPMVQTRGTSGPFASLLLLFPLLP